MALGNPSHIDFFTMTTDFSALLEQARNGASRSIFTPYMEEISDPKGFQNPVQLRLLGNAIANSPENAEILATNEDAMKNLLSINPLGLQVLYNGTIGNLSFAQQVLNTLISFSGQIRPSPAAKSLLGSVWELCGEEVPREFVVKLVTDGFVELVLLDPSLETEPGIVKSFKAIYETCQGISIASDEADDFDSLGIRVVGNISAHRSFGIDQADGITQEPFTWETVVLLANLSAEKANVERVVQTWPQLVEKSVRLIEAEDPDGEDVGPAAQDTDLSDAEPEAPFDLELWGSLFRNISRSAEAAREIAKHKPSKLFTRLLESPPTQELAGDFASTFAAQVYDHDLTEVITTEPFNGGSVLISSAIVEGLAKHTQDNNNISQEELNWALGRLSRALVNGMLADPKEPVWIKGSKALALLKGTYNHFVDITPLAAHEITAQSDPVRQNLSRADAN